MIDAGDLDERLASRLTHVSGAIFEERNQLSAERQFLCANSDGGGRARQPGADERRRVEHAPQTAGRQGDDADRQGRPLHAAEGAVPRLMAPTVVQRLQPIDVDKQQG